MKAIDCQHVNREDETVVNGSPPVRDGYINGHHPEINGISHDQKPSENGIYGGEISKLNKINTAEEIKSNGISSEVKMNGIMEVKLNGISEIGLSEVKINGLSSEIKSNGISENGLSEVKLNGFSGENRPTELKLNELVEVKLNGISPEIKTSNQNGEVKLNGISSEIQQSNGNTAEVKLNGVKLNEILPEIKSTLNGFSQGHSDVKLNGLLSEMKSNGFSTENRHEVNDLVEVKLNGHVTPEEGGGCVAKLEEQLSAANHELKLRDEEVARLSRIRTEVESELEELTASLFQEAHNMVRQANVAQAQAERNLKESHMKVEVLQAEVAALKTLVITSTPSKPNPHLHPQLQQSDSAGAQGMNLFNRKHRRSPSHFNLKYGRENSPPDSPVRDVAARGSPIHLPLDQTDHLARDDIEVDPILHKEFVCWRQTPRLDQTDPFVSRIYREDIDLCLDFCNKELGSRVRTAVQDGLIFIEAVTEKSRTVFPKKCALMEVQRLCHYRMRLGDQEQWFHISQICRNRITAVCDFLNYLKYIERGLVKSSVPDVFWEIVRLRKEMALARLGLPLS